MKSVVLLSAILLLVMTNIAFSQEKSSSATKEERKLEQQMAIKALIDSKEFVFVANTAMPSGMRSVSLTSNSNYIRFHPDLIDCSMPYFGRSYGGGAYGGDGGLKFSNKPEEFNVTEKKKNYQVNATVRSGNDLYKLSMSVNFNGSATISIITSTRSTISYQGDISPKGKLP